MKLNPDCARDLMLFIEEKTYIKDAGKDGGSFHSVFPDAMINVSPLNKYTLEEILYHTIQLSESGYIITNFKFDKRSECTDFSLSEIYYMTPKGHEFTASIMEKSHWEKSKKIFDSLKDISLSIIETVAADIMSTAISNLFNHC